MPNTPFGLSTDVLQGARPDPNPIMECDGCGGEWRVSYFDENGQLTPDPDEPILCASCKRKPVGTRTVEERQKANHSIMEYETSEKQ